MNQKSNTLELLESALNKNELPDFIFGRKNYGFTNKFIETPTDLDTIFLHGFNKYVINHGRKDLSEKISIALIDSLTSPENLWWVIFFIYDYKLGYKENALDFDFDILRVIDSINDISFEYEEYLKHCKEFVGYRFKNGLWENLTTMVNKLNNHLENKIAI